ncbi:MAG: peptidoglycan bridge formation glycyltransferase FemA/FemB family protein [candidate division WOR-3 bacterium]
MKAESIPINWTPDLSIFASEPFLQAVGDEYGWIGGVDNSGQLRCILPYTIIRKGPIRMARFRVETVPLDGAFEVEEERAFLNSTVRFLRSAGADMIIPGTTNSIFRTYPEGAIAVPYGTYIIDLAQPEEAIWGGLSASHRRKIRLAAKEGVEIRDGIEHLETAYRLVRDTFRRSAIPFMGLDSFRRMMAALGDNVRIMLAEHRGAAQACVVIPFRRHSAYYVYGGSIPKPVTGATNLLHWEAIRHFHRLGVRRYDFVGVRINPPKGSKQEGLSMFKERFGGQLVQGYMWKYPIRRLKYRFYSVGVRLFRGGDIVDAERHKLLSSELFATR